MKLALAQFGVFEPKSFVDFFARIADAAYMARLGGANLLVLPEYASMVLAGAFIKSPDIAAELEAVVSQAEKLIAAMQDIAREEQIYILGGTIPMRVGERVYNRAPFISSTGALAFQEKKSMTRFEAEKWGITGGAGPKIFATQFGLIGISICYDSEFPLHVRAQATAGAKLILIPSCTDSIAGFNRVRLSARARAIENQCFTATSPLVGTAPWSGAIDENHGYAAVYTPPDHGFPASGILHRGEMDAPSLVLTEIDLSLIDNVRRNGGVLNHRDWPDAIPPCPIVTLE
jgi:predicted amidohydrolase